MEKNNWNNQQKIFILKLFDGLLPFIPWILGVKYQIVIKKFLNFIPIIFLLCLSFCVHEDYPYFIKKEIPIPENNKPEITLRLGTIDFAINDTYNFGITEIDKTKGPIIFTIENSGSADLLLTGTQDIEISGFDKESFTIVQPSGDTIFPGNSLTFSVAFHPASFGEKNADIIIRNNDADENIFILKITGSVEIIDIDYLVIRFYWTTENGIDLDCRTALINPPRNIDVGWYRNSFDQDYLIWGDDNTQIGFESVLINIKAINRDYPSVEIMDIRIRAFWYESRGDGNFNIEFSGYKGGTMNLLDYNWINSGGELISTKKASKNAITITSDDTDGDEMGIVKYNFTKKSLSIFAQ